MMQRLPHSDEAITGDAAALYEEVHQKHAKFYEKLARDIAALNIAGNYLEIGSGTGFLAGAVASLLPNVKITGLDLSPQMVEMASKYVQGKGVPPDRVRFMHVNASERQQVQSLNQKFDLVYSTFSLHHWEEPQKIFQNIWEAVKDGGSLYVFDFKRVWWMYYIPINRGDFNAVRASYTAGELRTFLTQAGVKNFKLTTHVPFVFQSVIAKK